MIVQLEPFQRSINVFCGPDWSLNWPTAKQLVAVGHATPCIPELFNPFGFGVATIVQTLPFQRSTNALPADWPTAKQVVAVGHATPESRLETAPFGFGLTTTVHELAPRRTTRVLVEPPEKSPTAKQVVAVVHETPASSPLGSRQWGAGW